MKKYNVITSAGCVKCMLLKQFLDSQNIAYTEISLDEGQKVIDKYKIQQLPVLFVYDIDNNINYIEGFNPIKVNEFLRRNA